VTPDVWTRLTTEVEDFTHEIRDLPVLTRVTPAEVRAKLESRYTFRSPVPLAELTDDMIGLLRRWTVHVTHPRYFGLFNPSVRQAAIVGDALTALYNPQLAAWSHAPAANEIERHTLRALAAAIGLDAETMIANFTTGGAEANQSAVLAALAHRFPEAEEEGVAGLRARPAIYLTSESHHSFVKIARMAGLGTRALREVPLTQSLVMDPDALRRQVEADRAAGWDPLMIVGTAGTTGGGLVDPLPELADVAKACDAWFNVDGAWGAAAALAPRLRAAVYGIERADSLTWDAHKWLSVPMGAGMFFCRHPASVARAFGVSTSYMPDGVGGDSVDAYVTTAQWTRRFIGLKVFMALAELGLDGYGELIDRQARIGDRLRLRLRETGWLVVNDTPLPVICFTHAELQAGGPTTHEILEAIYARGRVWISDVSLGGRERVLRACITSFRSDEADVECLIEELEKARTEPRTGEPGPRA
jgi:aromatic-L-amino-acid/L-tryptophan decarboxylase